MNTFGTETKPIGFDYFVGLCHAEYLKLEGSNLKCKEIAIQNAIEILSTTDEWWKVTRVSIFGELLAGNSPYEICEKVWPDIQSHLEIREYDAIIDDEDELVF